MSLSLILVLDLFLGGPGEAANATETPIPAGRALLAGGGRAARAVSVTNTGRVPVELWSEAGASSQLLGTIEPGETVRRRVDAGHTVRFANPSGLRTAKLRLRADTGALPLRYALTR